MTNLTYIALALATTAYALALESLRRAPKRTYAPRWTWLTVVVGVAIVGGFVALHIAFAPPADAWAGWWLWTLHFVAGGLPIIVWQELVDRRDADAATRRLMARRRALELDEEA